jgi:hypothetical protein
MARDYTNHFVALQETLVFKLFLQRIHIIIRKLLHNPASYSGGPGVSALN